MLKNIIKKDNEFNLNINIYEKNKIIKYIETILNRFSLPLFIALISFIILTIIFSNSIINKSKINDNIFRIHIVANSNNIEDQIIKHKINEKILNYINTLDIPKNINSKEYSNLLKNNINDINKIVNSELIKNNKNYNSKIKIGNINYKKKENINFSMKEGNYESIQILLGEAKGKNVWNLIFPNKENIKKLKYFNNILPNIDKIFN